MELVDILYQRMIIYIKMRCLSQRRLSEAFGQGGVTFAMMTPLLAFAYDPVDDIKSRSANS